MIQKHIHFIGICGVAMSALAIAFHKKGWYVTGSDKGFYPPVSTHLKDVGITYYPGWHVQKMTAKGNPDLVVVGNVASSTNPEYVYVQENHIAHASYPEVLADFFIKKNSLVCSGTYGKSTSTALLTWILKCAKKDPSYMFGGISRNNIDAAEMTDGEWSIMEGDEYKTARWDNRAKFFHYSPTHLLLTSVVWDHADVYPTKQSYIDAFQELITSVPSTGLGVVSAKVLHDHPTLCDTFSSPFVTYGKTPDNTYQYTNVTTSPSGVSFDIIHNGTTYHIDTPELGDYMADNMTGCFAMAHEIGIDPATIIHAIESFKSIKRRLEKRLDGKITVFDDIAHSPKKAEAVLRSLRLASPTKKIIAVFEPNTGNRQQEAIPGYANAFDAADLVIIPRLTKVKHDPTKPDVLDSEQLAKTIADTHKNVLSIENDETLVSTICTQATPGDSIVFLGSHGFRGMIEDVVKKLS